MHNPLAVVAPIVLALARLDLVALRFGADSRPRGGERRDWW